MMWRYFAIMWLLVALMWAVIFNIDPAYTPSRLLYVIDQVLLAAVCWYIARREKPRKLGTHRRPNV